MRDNPAFDEYRIADGETTQTEASGDGDGDSSGDGDPTTMTGDGDGEATTTTGDGDGDPTTGDGDGDPTTGDGDGDPTTGDGDGDNLPVLDVFDPDDLCEQAAVPEPYEPLLLIGGFSLELANLPGFAQQDLGCQELIICDATQVNCSSETPFFTKVASGQVPSPGVAPMQPTAIQLHFVPGNPNCGMPPLLLDPTQNLGISYFVENVATFVEIRMPCFDTTDLRLWVGADGSTFYNEPLTIPAALW